MKLRSNDNIYPCGNNVPDTQRPHTRRYLINTPAPLRRDTYADNHGLVRVAELQDAEIAIPVEIKRAAIRKIFVLSIMCLLLIVM